MPDKRSPTPATRRFLAMAVAAVALGATAACGGSMGSPSSGSTTGPSPSLGPWQGALTTTTLPAPVQTLRAVACATAQRCWAVGSTLATSSAPAGPALVATTDGGASWAVLTLPPTVGYLSGVACTSARSCTAVGQVGVTGVGPGAILTTTNGTTWALQVVPPGTTDVTAVDCRVDGRCTALGVVSGVVSTLTPSHAGTWVATGRLPAPASVATALSCTDATHCWATAAQSVDVGHVIGAIDVTSDGGATWAPQNVPVGTGALQGIDCTPGTDTTRTATGTGASCTAVGTTATVLGGARTGQGVVLTTANGGSRWAAAPVTAASADLLAVSCTAGPCVAVGTTAVTAPQAGVVILTGTAGASGGIWRQAVTAPVALPLTAVACVSLSACVVVGESVTAHLAAG